MTVYVREKGQVKKCSGLFSLDAAEQLTLRFPRKFRFAYRDSNLAIMEVLV